MHYLHCRRAPLASKREWPRPAADGVWNSKSFCRFLEVLPFFFLAALFISCYPLRAQTASFSGAKMQLAGNTGFLQLQGLALDSKGNLYIADTGNNVVREMEFSGGVYQAPINLPAPSGGYNSPYGVAVAGNGDVFVADTQNGAIQRIPAGCSASSCIVEIGSPSAFNQPNGVAVDSSGNIFVANSGLNEIDEIPIASGYTTVNRIATGFVFPVGVAVDKSGNIFVASYGDSAVFEVPFVGGIYQARQTIGSGFNKPNGVSIDRDGNLYIADTHNSVIKEIAASDLTSVSPTITTISTGFSLPVGVSADPGGNLFVADYSGGPSSLGAVYEVMRSAVNFGAVSVGQTSTALALQFTFAGTSSTAIGAPIVLTGPATNGDFADAGTGTCTTTNGISNPYSPGSSCTIDITFRPARAGVSRGAAELVDASGNLLSTVYLSGFGVGPEITFNPGPETTQGSGFRTPAGLAADQAGNIYVADAGNNSIKMIAGGTSNTLATGFNNPQGVAIDGAGNVFVADTGNNSVKEIVASDNTIRSLGGSFSFAGPKGIAVDGAGNLFVADTGNGAVEEMTAADGFSVVSTLASGFTSPSAIAVDGQGDAVVIDSSSTPVREIVAVDGVIGTSPVIQTLGIGWTVPASVAIDAFGNVYVADAGSGTVAELPLNGTSYGSPIILDSGFNSPGGIATDWRGNIDLSDSSLNQIVQLALSAPPSFNFAVTQVGQTSADSPKTVTITNLGSGTLTFSGLTFPTDFPQASATTCTSSITLAQNQSCQVSIDFSPTSNSVLSEDVVLTDDTLNAPGTTQQIALNGATAEIAFTQPTDPTLPSGTVDVAYGPLTFQAGGGTGTGYTWSATGLPPGLSLDPNSGILSGTPSTAVTSASVTITATDSGTGSSGAQASKVYQITIVPGTVTLTWNPPASIDYGVSLSGVLNATATSGGNAVPGTWSYTAQVSGGSDTTVTAATVLNAGNYVLRATFTPTDSVDFKSAWASASLNVAAALLTVSANSFSRTYGTANPIFTGSVTGAINGDTFIESFTTAATTGSNAGTYAIVPAVSGANLNNYSTVIENGILTVAKAGTNTTLTVNDRSGTSVDLSAIVASTTSGTPTGTVSFYDGSTLLTTIGISGGNATYSTSFPPGSSHTLSAVYSGDVNFLTSSSASSPTTVPTLDFTLTAAPNSATAGANSAASFNLTLTPTSGIYPGNVSFTVSGLPDGATASFNPSSLAANAGPATVTLTVQTPSEFAAAEAPHHHSRLMLLSILLLPLFGMGGLRRGAGRLRRMAAVFLLLVSGFAATSILSGCGGKIFSNQRTYSLMVSATSGTMQHSSPVSLTVN